MRPEILFPAFKPITSIAGIGPRLSKLLEKLAGPKMADLYWHLPSGLIDRRFSPTVADAPHGRIVTMTLHVDEHVPSKNRRQPYKVLCSDGTGSLTLVYFHGREDYLRRLLPPGEERVVSGRVEHYGQDRQIAHPDHVCKVEDRDEIPAVEAVYPLTAGVTGKTINKAVRAALAEAPDLPEWHDPQLMKREGWPAWREALRAAHSPMSESDLAADARARARLAYDELLSNQLALELVRRRMRASSGRVIKGNGELREKLARALPYQLTAPQVNAIAEIESDMAQPLRMLRLLQGDVGSGKTIVALMSMLIAVEDGAQAALMAPTEILARQHFEGLAPLAEGIGLNMALLTGRDKGKARAALLERLASGEIDILVGTHALFQQDVAFHDLAMVVIDEQHRFGVHQRLTLAAKGRKDKGGVDVLVMTATPIPRTLTLTAYGDMDVSKLTEKPPGRKPVDTRVVAVDRLPEIVEGIRRKVEAGDRVYWVCPLVAESEVSDLAAAEERYAALTKVFGDRVGVVHGQMKGPEKDKVMADFAAGNLSVLVATTVIEVGVDVPEATVMVIEHAERFGLAQLHQLRGRIGRGGLAGTCLLLYSPPLSETMRARLDIMRNTEDGFLIAEEDLRLRGAGELLGTRQSGMPEFRVADIAAHGELMAMARDDAKLVLEKDPELKSPRGDSLRTLLYLFERDAAVLNLRSG